MTTTMMMIKLSVVAIALAFPMLATAKTITVGGSAGWGLSADYVKWAKAQSFSVGDTLLFKFTQGMHDVTIVSKQDYEACNIADGLSTTQTEPPVSININSSAPLYFMCTIPGHCTQGQKLAVTEIDNTGPSHPPAQAPQNAKKDGRAHSPAHNPKKGGHAHSPAPSPHNSKKHGHATSPSASPEVPPVAGPTSPEALGPTTTTPSSPAHSFAAPMATDGLSVIVLSFAAIGAMLY